jgi:hypothetical protein
VIATYIRGASKENHAYKLPITPAGREDAKRLRDALVKGDPEWGSLHDLMRRIWEEPELDGPDTGRSTFLMAFLAAAALREDGSLMEPDGLSPFLSHLKYGARSFCMIEATETQGNYKSILE